MEIMLNPARRRKKRKSPKVGRKKASRRKHRAPKKRCLPKADLRRAKSLKRLKRRLLFKHKRAKQVCIPVKTLTRAKSLKTLKSRYAGVKYGFARRRKAARGGTAGGLLPGLLPTPRARRRPVPGVKYSYMDIVNLSPLEREMRGITEKHLRTADKRGHVMVKPPKEKEEAASYPEWKPTESVYGVTGSIAANPRRRNYRFNYTVPVYAFNDTLSMGGLRDGLTAGYRPRVLMQVVPVVGGLVANGIVSGMLSKVVAERLNLDPTAKGPAGLALGLLSAGALSVATRMVAPRHAQAVFLGGLAQVMWDGYQTYLQPLVKKWTGLGCCEIGEQPDLTFGLWCPECADSLNDFLSPVLGRGVYPPVSRAVASVLPPADMAMQAPPMPSAPVTATVNGKEVIVEKVIDQPSGTSGFGDFLTPNQVAQATPLGDFGTL
ncbi:MAG: hypothetical protein ABII82_10910 [Verrucomicrobiota bacterium]